MTPDDYEVVTRDSTSLAEARAHNGFTKVPGQCYYCSTLCKNLMGLRWHQKACREKAKGKRADETKRRGRKPTRPSVIDGGVISDDDNIELPPTQPAPHSDASSSTLLGMQEIQIKLQRACDETDKLKVELSEVKDKYIQLRRVSRQNKTHQFCHSCPLTTEP